MSNDNGSTLFRDVQTQPTTEQSSYAQTWEFKHPRVAKMGPPPAEPAPTTPFPEVDESTSPLIYSPGTFNFCIIVPPRKSQHLGALRPVGVLKWTVGLPGPEQYIFRPLAGTAVQDFS
eukprot:12420457-Karenia_brevis.AAC.1